MITIFFLNKEKLNEKTPILQSSVEFFMSQQMNTNVHENIFLRRNGVKEMMNENSNTQ